MCCSWVCVLHPGTSVGGRSWRQTEALAAVAGVRLEGRVASGSVMHLDEYLQLGANRDTISRQIDCVRERG